MKLKLKKRLSKIPLKFLRLKVKLPSSVRLPKGLTLMAKEVNSSEYNTFHEPEIYSRWRARLSLYALPLVIFIIILFGFCGDIEDYPQYVTASAMGICGFLFLIFMVRHGNNLFWKIFGGSLIVFLLISIFMPAVLSISPQIRMIFLSAAFFTAGFLYWLKMKWKKGTL
jgi:hypothetical protein